MKRALISVSDKTGIIPFAKELINLGYEIISTGGTHSTLVGAGLNVIGVSEVTGFPECLDGRVKTLHPAIHAGVLAVRKNHDHMSQLRGLDIKTIDMVIVNLYPFKATILKQNVNIEEAIENIDIGGPTMIRAAAKNYQDVTVVVDPDDYRNVIEEIKTNGKTSDETNFYLAAKVFNHTAHYDSLIASYMFNKTSTSRYPDTISLTYEKVQDVRYGENPHQNGAFYKEVSNKKGVLACAEKLHGKELSFNNINDSNGALMLLKEFEHPVVVAVKHTNPCGVGMGSTIAKAYAKAYESDPVSVYGGIIAANREIDENTARKISEIFIEVVIAPGFTQEALNILMKKKNIRLLKLEDILTKEKGSIDLKKVSGGVLIQDTDDTLYDEKELKCVTKREPTNKEVQDLIFAMKIVKHMKSNAIVITKDGQIIGTGTGQVNRIWACKQAIEHGTEQFGIDGVKGAVLATDAFFPFPDCVEECVKAGITAIINPSGSVNDQMSIDVCNRYDIAMLSTGMRHFKH